MKITNVEFIPLTATTRTGHNTSAHAALKVHTDEGLTGICHVLENHGPAINELGPLIIGENPINSERIWHSMYKSIGNLRRDQRELVNAMGALDIAVWDLKGKMLETPLHRLLGGFRSEIPAYADGRMALRTPEQHAEWSAHFIHDMGYRATKYHVMGEAPDQIVLTAKTHQGGDRTRTPSDDRRPQDLGPLDGGRNCSTIGRAQCLLAGGAGAVGRRGGRHGVSVGKHTHIHCRR